MYVYNIDNNYYTLHYVYIHKRRNNNIVLLQYVAIRVQNIFVELEVELFRCTSCYRNEIFVWSAVLLKYTYYTIRLKVL